MKIKKFLVLFIYMTLNILSITSYNLKTELQDVPPKFYSLPNGQIAGISFDIMQLIEKSSEFKFSYEKKLIPISRIIVNLEKNNTQIQFGLQKTSERQKNLIYGEELYKIKIVGLVRNNSTYNIKSISDLKKYNKEIAILTQYGTAVDSSLKKINGLNIDSGSKSLENSMEKLLLGRGQLIIYHDLSINYLLNNPKYKGKFKLINIDFEGNKELNEVAQYVVFSKEVPLKTREEINEIIKKMKKDNKINEILKNYRD